MSYELNRLLQYYGVESPTLTYGGTPNMVSPTRPEPTTEAPLGSQAYADKIAEFNALVDKYNVNQPKYLADKAAFDTYKTDYRNQIANTPMYGDAQFQYRPRNTPGYHTPGEPAPIVNPGAVYNADAYFRDNPDVAQAYANRASDPNLASTVNMTPEEFARTHYEKFGQNEQRRNPNERYSTLPIEPGGDFGLPALGQTPRTVLRAPTYGQSSSDGFTPLNRMAAAQVTPVSDVSGFRLSSEGGGDSGAGSSNPSSGGGTRGGFGETLATLGMNTGSLLSGVPGLTGLFGQGLMGAANSSNMSAMQDALSADQVATNEAAANSAANSTAVGDMGFGFGGGDTGGFGADVGGDTSDGVGYAAGGIVTPQVGWGARPRPSGLMQLKQQPMNPRAQPQPMPAIQNMMNPPDQGGRQGWQRPNQMMNQPGQFGQGQLQASPMMQQMTALQQQMQSAQEQNPMFQKLRSMQQSFGPNGPNPDQEAQFNTLSNQYNAQLQASPMMQQMTALQQKYAAPPQQFIGQPGQTGQPGQFGQGQQVGTLGQPLSMQQASTAPQAASAQPFTAPRTYKKGGVVRKFAVGGLNSTGGDEDLNSIYEKYFIGGESSPALPEVGGGQKLSPALRAAIQQDAAAQGITDPITSFTGAGKTGSYGLDATPAVKPLSAPAAPKPLQAMYDEYAMPNTYGAELSQARRTAASESERFNKLLESAMSQPNKQGPSKAEMYFQLAAALSSPTKTGTFGETLGNASRVMGEHQKATREAEQSDKSQKLQLGLEIAKARMGAAKDDVTALRQLAGEELKAWVASGKPQSAAGKQAQDEGFVPGTPDYQKRVAEVGEMLVKKQTAQIEALVASQGAQQGRLTLETKKFEAGQKQGARLTPKELDLRVETEDAINTGASALGNLQQALKLNPQTFDTSLKDRAQRKLLEETQSDHPRVTATREQENLLGTQAMTQLKSLVGGNPTEGERAVLMGLQGVGAKSKEERATIINNAIAAAQARLERNKKRLADIKAGRYRETTPETGAE